MSSKLKPIQVCQNLLREVYKASSNTENKIGKDYIMTAYRSNQTTSAKFCREQQLTTMLKLTGAC